MDNYFETDTAKNRVKFLLGEYRKPNLLADSTTSQELMQFLDEYNWDDGMEITYYMSMHQNCDLAVALNLFYLSDGTGILDEDFENCFNKEWIFFVKHLYNRILNGDYKKGTIPFEVPLTKVQRYHLKKNNFPEIFITDI